MKLPWAFVINCVCVAILVALIPLDWPWYVSIIIMTFSLGVNVGGMLEFRRGLHKGKEITYSSIRDARRYIEEQRRKAPLN